MPEVSAKEIQRLRKETGAGMMDAKRALESTGGDFDAARRHLREQGIAGTAKRAGRENTEGAVALGQSAGAVALVALKCETDFVAKSDDFVRLGADLAASVADDGEDALAKRADDVERLQITLKENIAIGEVVRFEVPGDHMAGTYLHVQAGRGVNGVLVELDGGSDELAHDIAVHIAFARPQYLTRDEVPAEEVAAERATLETISRNEGKPEAALGKIVEGRLNGWFKERCLTDQPYVRDEKVTVAGHLGAARVVRFAQVTVGG